MSDAEHSKPVPARAAAEPPRGKPTPVRELSGDAAPQVPEADVPEASIEVEGATWAIRVLGRSGGAAGTAPPLLLLGFWDGEGDGEPVREALVVGTALSDLSTAALHEAFEEAREPRDRDRRTPFFAEAGQSRRR